MATMWLTSSVSRLLSTHVCLAVLCLLSTVANAATLAKNVTAAADAQEAQNQNVSIAVASGTTVNSKVLIIARGTTSSCRLRS